MMTTRRFQLHFLTPAFLGNAEQDGQWRAPPIKALLRQWWRVAWAEAQGFSQDFNRMRHDEGVLFGAAADGQGNKSRLRLRLGRWDRGRLTHWEALDKVSHPEVKPAIGADLYLGYGPLSYDKAHKGVKLKSNAAIQAGESAELRLAFPEADAPLLDRALALMDLYGTLGGRSGNGWGSFALAGDHPDLAPPLRAWRDCLDCDWPHAIGSDEQGPLIWRTGPFTDWKQLMRQLARIKIGLRTQKKFELALDESTGDEEIFNKKGERAGINHGAPQLRHWLSYPVTNHSVTPWGNDARLPNSLRFKVRKDGDGRLHGLICHIPCLPPSQFHPQPKTIEKVWQQVYTFLDGHSHLARTAR